MSTNIPPTLRELQELRKPVININKSHREKLSRLDKIAMIVTKKVGTMGFFFIILTWTVCWLAWNTLGPQQLQFDPFPAFVMWLFISNMIQIMLMPLIMIGQNLESRHSEIRAESEYETSIKSEREIGVIIQHLENQNKILSEIIEKIK